MSYILKQIIHEYFLNLYMQQENKLLIETNIQFVIDICYNDIKLFKCETTQALNYQFFTYETSD